MPKAASTILDSEGRKRKQMFERFTEVSCPLKDCLFHHVDSKQPGKVFCKHPEKASNSKVTPCPLYRLDWQKQAGSHLGVLKLVRK